MIICKAISLGLKSGFCDYNNPYLHVGTTSSLRHRGIEFKVSASKTPAVE